MTDIIPPSSNALKEALELSSEILRNIELNELPLTNIALKTSRLARLLNDYDYQAIMEYEARGYLSRPDGIPPEVWKLAVIAGRKQIYKDSETEETKEYAYIESIAELEHTINIAKASLEAEHDPDISISSANPYQPAPMPVSHRMQRYNIRTGATTATRQLSERRSFIYGYVLRRHYELKFSDIADDIFSRIRERVDASIGTVLPEGVKKLTAIHENLRSENAEDWSNAVHSCRRLLQDLADALFPPQEKDGTVHIGKTTKKVKLRKGNYINRIVAFIEDNSTSDRFEHIVGSHLEFIGNRLDSVFQATQKGSHVIIIRREEADRYVVYTYMIVSDILSLLEDASNSKPNINKQDAEKGMAF